MPDMWIDVDAAVAVPVNKFPLIDDTDFKTREVAIAYDEAGMDLVWNFVTSAGVMTQTAVTPTTAGDYDWTHVGDGMYKIEITASGGVSINNDAEGYGWFSGICTGVLAWISPVYGFRAAGLNDKLTDSAYSATLGLAGTALPAAAADGAGGLPISDAGGLDLDAKLAETNEVTAARMGALTDWINGGRLDLILDIIAADTTTDIPALIATAQADLDIITGADGTTLATSQGNYAPAKAADILTTALTEAYSTKGAAATLSELLYEIIGQLREKTVVTTTETIKKIDGSTTAYTNSLNDAASPTSVTRAT